MEEVMNAQQNPGRARVGNRLVAIGLVVALASAVEMVVGAKIRNPGDQTVACDGTEVGDPQHKAYAGLAPLTATASKEKVFEAAKAAFVSMGMQLADADMAQGRIEATQTSLLYGF